LKPWTWKEAGWFFVAGRIYLLRLSLLDARKDVLFVPPNFRIDFACRGNDTNACPLEVLQTTANHQVIMFRAGRVGSGTVFYGSASIADESHGSQQRNWPELTAEFNFHVAEPLHVKAPFAGPLVLPPNHIFALVVTGGSGFYTFKASSNIVEVSTNGIIQSSAALGNAKIEVLDARNIANSISLIVLIRQPGALFVKPILQFQLSSNGDKKLVPVLAQPAALAGDDTSDWHRLRFWNCSGFGVSLSTEGSSDFAEVVWSSEEAHHGACCSASVLPKSPGDFTLSASLFTTGTRGENIHLHASSLLQVYAPLTLTFDERDEAGKGQHPEAHISLCSTATLVLHGGPFSKRSSSRILKKLICDLEGSHLRLRSAGERSFEILCLKPTPGRVQVFAEVSEEPSDSDTHGGAVVGRASAWVTCAAPVTTNVLPAASVAGAMFEEWKSKSGPLGLRQGQRQQFGVRFLDGDGRHLITSSSYRREWMVSFSDGSESEQLKSTHPIISVPSDAIPGTGIKLSVVASLPETSNCSTTYDLELEHAEALRESLASSSSPTIGTLDLRIIADLAVRWPGYPSRNLAFAPDWAFTFETAYGSGEASLSFDDSMVSHFAADATCKTDSSLDGCSKVVSASDSIKGARIWLLRPSRPGHTQIVVDDASQLGAAPAVIDVSFLPLSRISIALSDVQATARTARLLLVRGRQHPLAVELQDTAGQPLSFPNWAALQLKIEATEAGLDVISMGDGAYVINGSTLGSFELQATARNDENSVVYSNILPVYVFDTFSISPADAVILPGQTFEFTRHGSAVTGAASSVAVEFTSSHPDVAQVHSGIITGVSEGAASIVARLLEVETGRELATVSAQVMVVLPNEVVIEPMEGSGKICTSAPLLVRGSLDSLRLVASLKFGRAGSGCAGSGSGSAGKYVLTRHLLTPMQSQASRGCHFMWSSGDASVSLVTLGDSNLNGAGVVDVSAAEVSRSDESESVKLTVLVDCPHVPRLESSLDVLVVQHLRLLAPVAEYGTSASVAWLRMHPLARVPLVFNQPTGNLQISLTETGDAKSPTLRLDHHNQFAELVAGSSEGVALAVVRDQRVGSSTAPLMLTIVVRDACGLQLSPTVPRRLILGSIAELNLQLRDESGAALALSSESRVEHSVSHPSILDSSIQEAPTGGKVLRLSAIKEGCAGLNISAKMPVVGECDSGACAHVLSDIAMVCVSPGALMGHHQPLVVQPGAAIHFAVDAAVARGEEDVLSFLIRFQLRSCDFPSTQAIDKALVVDISRLLELPIDAVSILDIRPSGGGFDAIFGIRSVDLPQGVGLPELARKLWFHPGLADAGEILRHLDLAYGMRAPTSPRTMHSSILQSACSDGAGLFSLDSAVLDVIENEAIANQLGETKAQICHGAVVAEAKVVVADISEIRAEVQSGGPFLASRTDSGAVGARVTNRAGMGPLVVLVRFFARDNAEILSGPFQSQNIEFVCSSGDYVLDNFFTFEAWQAFSSSAGGPLRHEGLVADSSIKFPWSEGAAQAACIVYPKKPDVRKLENVFAPRTLSLHVSARCKSCVSPPSRTVDWAFVPQFIVFSGGKVFGPRETCGTLTVDKPTVDISVWTGGYPIEAELARQLRSASRGVLAVHAIAHTGATAATVSLTVVWDAAWEFSGFEEVDLHLESRASGQTHVLKIIVDGSRARAEEPVGVAILPARPRELFVSLGLIMLFLLSLVVICLGCVLLHQQADIAGSSSFPPIQQPVARTLPSRQRSNFLQERSARNSSGGDISSMSIPQQAWMSPFRPSSRP